MTMLKSSGMTNYEILMLNTSDEIQELAVSYGEKLAMNECLMKI